MTAPREKPAPLVWAALRDASDVQRTVLGTASAIVWRADAASRPWRALLVGGAVTSHAFERTAKASAEKRLRKAGA